MSLGAKRDILPIDRYRQPAPPRRRHAGRRSRARRQELPGGRWHAFGKVVMDAVIAAALLVLTAPLLLAVVVLVKATSRGPAFYSQTRLGYKGRRYRIFKVRTMTHDCERHTGPQWSTKGDPRITPVGRFLRASHLDELPQLWNVLRGDMSLIGPRPERPEISVELDRRIPHYRGRLLVRPGVSGLAQVRLPADTDLASVRLKLAYDLYYVQHPGLWFDLRLMLATGFKVLRLPFALTRTLLALPRDEAVESPYRNWLRLGVKVRGTGWQAEDEEDTASAYDLDLSKMGEPELEVLARECGYYPAATELILRDEAPILRLA